MDNELFTRKTRMVFFSIEKTIGDLIKDNFDVDSLSESLKTSILEREVKNKRPIKDNTIESYIQASYFLELFDIAIDCHKESNMHEKWKELKDLAISYSLIDLRNRLSHPNRPFFLSDWYRVGLFSSDHLIDTLGLRNIKSSLLAAENNDLIDPPNDWFESFEYSLPNNLPDTFEHSLTGLLGRNKELKKLKKQINHPRINTVTIVAPGGTGKTALALGLLDEVTHLPEFSESFDGVLFVSLKLEQQTTNGIKKISAPETIQELKSSIVDEYNDLFGENFEGFDDLCHQENPINLLLCVDNLETLIRDNEDYFNEFHLELPYTWKVLVTSRINIENSNVLPLEKLGVDAAKALAREYISRRGEKINEDVVKQIAEKCNYNPLSIKLTIDHFLLGNELPKSISKVNTDIAEFSFRNLVDNLNEYSVYILEVLFTTENLNRREISQYLELSIDDVARSISELVKTSLVNRIQEENREVFELNSSVREFLLLNPRNLKIRNQVKTRINKAKDSLIELVKRQKKKNTSIYSEYFIPEDTSTDLKLTLLQANKLLMGKPSHEKTRKAYNLLMDRFNNFDQEYLYHRYLSIVYRLMSDNIQQEAELQKALSLNGDDIASKILMSKLYHENREYEKALSGYDQILKSDNIQKVKNDETIYRVILNGYYLAKLFLDYLDDIDNETKKWRDDSVFGDTHGAYRAAGFRKMLETKNPRRDTEDINNIINSCLKILNTVFNKFGYTNAAMRESIKAIESILLILSTNKYSLTDEKLQLFISFCERNLDDIMANSKFSDSGKEIIKKLRLIDIEKNPFRKFKWASRSNPGFQVGLSSEEVTDKKLTKVHVTHIPKEGGLHQGFLFAEDAYRQEYFIHISKLINGSTSLFDRLGRGDPLAIHYEHKTDKRPAATECYFVKEA